MSNGRPKLSWASSSIVSAEVCDGASSRYCRLASLAARMTCTGCSRPGMTESRITSCRSTTYWTTEMLSCAVRAPRDQGRDLADRAGRNQGGRGRRHPDRALNQFFNPDRHERIQAEVGQRLVGAQAVRLDAQHGAHDLAQCLGDHALALLRRRG